MAFKVHEIDKYNYSLAARQGGAPGTVQLWGGGKLRARVRWVADNNALPAPQLAADLESASVYFRYDALHDLIDMLRNERPVHVTINDQPPGFVFVHTGIEPVGPEDEDTGVGTGFMPN